MAKIIFLFIVALHGFIHLLGFLKAYGLKDIGQITQSISKPFGVLWLLTALLFLGTFALIIFKKNLWWVIALPSVILSQILIISTWKDAKFGTIPNILILITAIINFSIWNFWQQVNKEIKQMLSENQRQEKVITESMIKDLPPPVQRWLSKSGIFNKVSISTAYLRQEGSMRLKPKQKKWIESHAEQYFTVEKPAFIWIVKLSIMGMPVVGRDLFKDGKGTMNIRLLGIIPVAFVKENAKINQSALQRYLGEISWFPTAALNPYIKWEAIGENIAKATLSYKGTTGSAVFYFNSTGDLIKLVAMRYYDIHDEEPKEWIAKILDYCIVDGIRIPSKIEATWVLESGEFTWYKFENYSIKFNKL